MRRPGLASLLLLAMPFATARSQATVVQPSPDPLRIWATFGAGPSHYGVDGGTTLRASATVSYRQALAMIRGSISLYSIDYTSSLDENAVLVGLRTADPNLYAHGAIGLSRAKWKNECYDNGPCLHENGPAGAFDFGVHASKLIAGLAANVFGVAGSGNLRLTAVGLAFEVGWFGR